MKKAVLFFALVCFYAFSVSAQNSSNVNVGDTFVIAEVDNDNYKHINFPKANLVIKRGGIVSYDQIRGKKVEVTSVKEKGDGTTIATIKLVSGKRFFSSHKFITVDIKKAIRNKELQS